jgi:hypothetical protein
VWLWDAGAWCGVTWSEKRAVREAEAHIGASGTAVVELARFKDTAVQTVHERTGVGMTGTARRGRVSWAPLTRAA